MLAHYLTIGWRGLARNRFHTIVSIASLALGLVSFVGAWVFVAHVENAERGFANSEHIFVMFQRTSVRAMDLALPSMSDTSPLLADTLRIDFPEIEAIARTRVESETVVSVGDQHSYRRVWYAEPGFLSIFRLPFVAGGAAATSDARHAFLTREAAATLFGSADPLGQIVRLNEQDIRVAGVIAPIPVPSHLDRTVGGRGFEILVVTNVAEDIEGSSALPNEALKWLGFGGSVGTYLLLPADGRLTAADLNARLPDFVARRVSFPDAEIAFEARHVSALARESLDDILFGASWSITDLLLLLGGLVLAIACLNFVNLAVARAATRTGEIGLRKAIGAGRAQVIQQHLCEAILVAISAAVLALVGLELAIPALNDALDLDLAPPRSAGADFWLFLGAVTLGVGLVAGAYPALVLARVQPIAALRAGAARAGPGRLRTLLIGLQFLVASLLLIAVTVVTAQNALLRRTALGIDEQPLVVIRTLPRDAKLDPETLRSRLAASPNVVAVTASSVPPWEMWAGGTGYTRTPDVASSFQFTQTQNVWYDYFEAFGMRLLAGRWFARDYADERVEGQPQRVVLDRRAALQLGWTDPEDAVGETIYQTPFQGDAAPATVIGVVEHAPRRVIGWGARSFIYVLGEADGMFPIVQVARSNVPAALAHIDSAWQSLAPQSPLRREFADESFARSYRLFGRVSGAFSILAGFAFAIAMVFFIATRRRREIGVRKILGASVKRIFRLLMWDFLRPVVVANIIAWPLAYFAARRYLELFMSPTPLTATPFLMSLAATVAIAGSVVVWQAVKSARVAPAALTRYE
jgi:putative ABC transport system permease protein